MITAVFDCVIYVQAALSRKGPAFACLGLAEEEHVTLYLSPDILDEVNRSLAQPTLRRKYTQLTDERVAKFLALLETVSIIRQNPPAVFSHPRDPKDERYVNLAVDASARFLVSRDRDLLDLMQDEPFRKRFPDVTILEPVAFLNLVRTEVARELGYS
jgi:putative PIN family toxin of toxin-antitoxin system